MLIISPKFRVHITIVITPPALMQLGTVSDSSAASWQHHDKRASSAATAQLGRSASYETRSAIFVCGRGLSLPSVEMQVSL